MTSADLIPAAVLKRKAVVYVRQSTQSQVMTNLEGQRRQYDLVEVARQWGFADVEVIRKPGSPTCWRVSPITRSTISPRFYPGTGTVHGSTAPPDNLGPASRGL